MRSIVTDCNVNVPAKCGCGVVSWLSRSFRTWDQPCKVRCKGCGSVFDLDEAPPPRRMSGGKASKKRKR